MVHVALVDDHALLRTGLAGLINTFRNYKVLFQASNGKEFINQLKPASLPDIVLMDITMPEMDGYETTNWLHSNYPNVKVIALSMLDNETAIIRMLKCGAKGYLLKDSEPEELKEGLDAVATQGTYFNELVSNKIIHTINNIKKDNNDVNVGVTLKDKEIEFLKWACTEKSYKEIADVMAVSPRTIDGYRDILCEKLGLKTRVGLVMYAIRNGIVPV
ncbi:response regulator [Chitinophagaceae bacterium LWZ2-11]